MARIKGIGSRASGRSSCSVVLRRSQRLLAQLGPRRSARLSGMPLPRTNPRTKPPAKPRKPSEYLMVSKPIVHTRPLKRTARKLSRAKIARLTLSIASGTFLMCHDPRGGYPYGDVERTCIYSDDNVETYSVESSPAGFTWVAIHEEYTTWAVFKKNEDAASRFYRNPGCWQTFYYEIGSVAISEVEGLADKNPATTFAVVSVIAGTTNALEVSSEQAVNFVRRKTPSGFPSEDTDNIQIAIGAFQLVCQEKLKASDIWVSVYNPLMPDWLFPSEIEEHLAHINTPDSGFYSEEDWAWMNRPARGADIS